VAANALHTPGPPGSPGPVDAPQARLDEAGLIAVQGPGPLDVRTGVLYGPGTTALITATSDTAPMAVLVGVNHAVTSRQASDGVYRGTTDVAVRVPIEAAPASGSRIDVIWEQQADAQSTLTPDATTEWLVSKTTGPADGTKPAIPVGALELGTVTVPAGATSTDGAGVTIANTVRQTVARNARVPVRDQADRDSLTRFAGLEVYRLDNGQVQLCPSASGTNWLTVYDPTRPVYTARPRGWTFERESANATDNFPSGAMASLIAGTITDAPAGDYWIHTVLALHAAAATSGNLRVEAGGVGLSEDMRADLNTDVRPINFGTTYAHAGGDLTLKASFQTGSQTGTIRTAGSRISASWLGPR
jgi:hypothetical protein